MEKSAVMILLLAVAVVVLALPEVQAQQYCKQLSPFTQRCVEQTDVDKWYPCELISYNEIRCNVMSEMNKAGMTAEIAKSGNSEDLKAFAVDGLVKSSFYSTTMTEAYTFTSIDGEKQKRTRPAPIWFDITKNNLLTFEPQTGMSYSIGYGSNNFSTTNFVNGTCDGCSIDTTIELKNTHMNTSRTNLAGEWLFTNNANDTSGKGNDGTAIGGATQKHERYEFDGVNDYINVTSSNSLYTNQSLTLAAWVNGAAGASTFLVHRLGAYGFSVSWITATSIMQRATFQITNTAGTAWIGLNATTDFVNNTWTHIVGTHNGSEQRIYINGILNNSRTISTNLTMFSGLHDLGIGAASTGTGGSGFFNGTIDEVRVWNRTLTAKEINDTYQNELYKYANETERTATYTSLTFNGSNRVTWNNITVTATNRTALNINTRTSGDNTTWESWKACNFTKTNLCSITSTPNTYLQYQLTFGTNNATYTPEISNVTIDHNNCIETWTATGWVTNGTDSYEYRNVNDTSGCGTTFSQPPKTRIIGSYFIATIILLSTAMLFLYRASIELDERHWQLKMGMFYAALALGWTGLNVVLKIAEDSAQSALMVDAVSIVYYAYSTIGILCVIWLGLTMFKYVFTQMIDLLIKKKTKSEEAW